jgi:hypothetical protein
MQVPSNRLITSQNPAQSLQQALIVKLIMLLTEVKQEKQDQSACHIQQLQGLQ